MTPAELRAATRRAIAKVLAGNLEETSDGLKDLEAAIDAEIAAARPQWQSIDESTPRDREILAWGYWAGEINGPDSTPSQCIICGRDKSTDYPGFNWRVAASDAYAEWFKPLKWMPLPDAPKGEDHDR